MTAPTAARPRSVLAVVRPSLQAVIAAVATFLGYLLLPRVAPLDFDVDQVALLLGILNGLAVGAAVRLDRTVLPWVAVAAALGTFGWLVSVESVHLLVTVVSLVIGAEVWALAYLVRRTGAYRLRAPGDLMRLLVVTMIVSTAGGLIVSLVASVDEHLSDSVLHLVRSWLIDDLFGLIVIAPALFTVRRAALVSLRQLPEYVIALAYTVLSTWWVFVVTDPANPGLFGWAYLVAIGTLWIAVRIGMRAVAPVVAVQYWFIVVMTVSGRGTMADSAASPFDRIVVAEMFGVTMAIVIFALAILRDRQEADRTRIEEASQLLHEVVDGSTSVIVAKNYDPARGKPGTYILMNEAGAALRGKAADEILGRTDADLLPEEVVEAFEAADRAVLSTREVVQANLQIAGADGVLRSYQTSTVPLVDAKDRAWGIVGFATDVTELVRTQEDLARQTRLMRAVFELSPTPAVRLSRDEGQGLYVRAANAAMCALLGEKEADVDGCDLLSHIDPQDAAVAIEVLERAGAVEGQGAPALHPRELRMRTEDGRTVWVIMSAAAVRGEGERLEFVAQFEDVTARRAAEQALSDQAMRDAVTGLPNRRALRERMDAALQRLRRHPGSVTVLFCDLDHFKDINDSLGHHVGDQLLVEVADRLRAALRPEDTIARLGGDEFVALGEGMTDPNDALVMAMRLQDRLSAPWVLDDQVFRPAMSIGIALTDDPDVSVDEMLRRADLAMYRAKEAGRNRVEMYDRTVDDAVQYAVTIQHELRRAIDNGTLELHYQPIVRLDDQRLVGMEALVRMRASDGRLMPPSDFVPQAESTGLVVPMGAWVIRQALTDLQHLHRNGQDTVMSVNVSPTQLREAGFSDFLLEQVAFAGVDPAHLAVEVTETALIHDPVHSARELTRLSDAGITISLDDFGTGYSSLSWLTQFPVDIVKIDKSFTDDIGLDPRKTAIVQALVSVSHELGFTVVAEGVESQIQADRLVALGCDRGQGYLYGKPTPIEEPPWT